MPSVIVKTDCKPTAHELSKMPFPEMFVSLDFFAKVLLSLSWEELL